MITASIVVYHTAAHELLRVINCAVRSAIEILYIIDNSSNDSLRELKDVSEKIVYTLIPQYYYKIFFLST